MKVLRKNSTGSLVVAWQNFLTGQKLLEAAADGVFGPVTERATKSFQQRFNLSSDGVVGRSTWSTALTQGFAMMIDNEDWPQRPSNLRPLTTSAKHEIFGRIIFDHRPISGNRENIIITNNFEKESITVVDVPELAEATEGQYTRMSWNVRGVKRLRAFFADLKANNLLHHIISYEGSWVPRLIRGSRTSLSSHAWGTAFDINYYWNKLGHEPAALGAHGSVRELVPLANKHGFFWGGHFARRDGMHFELALAD